MFSKYTVDFDLDDPRATLAHREIILHKPWLKRLYTDWYATFIAEFNRQPAALHLEIGAGGGFLKTLYPSVITSDILPLPHLDSVFSAESLPFANNELGSIVMLNVFHHIPRPCQFLQEAERTLATGGRIIMIEPANSRLSRFVFKRFHHEPFDEHGGREISAGNPLSNSNQALPYIYFERDLALFRQQFPQLRINHVHYHTPVAYVISGGLSRSALLPYWAYPLVQAVEYLLRPLGRTLGLFCTVEIEKTRQELRVPVGSSDNFATLAE